MIPLSILGSAGDKKQLEAICHNPVDLMTRLTSNPMSFKFNDLEKKQMIDANVDVFMTMSYFKIECKEDYDMS